MGWFQSLFDCNFCGNLVTRKAIISPISSPKLPVLNIENYNEVQHANSEQACGGMFYQKFQFLTLECVYKFRKTARGWRWWVAGNV